MSLNFKHLLNQHFTGQMVSQMYTANIEGDFNQDLAKTSQSLIPYHWQTTISVLAAKGNCPQSVQSSTWIHLTLDHLKHAFSRKTSIFMH